MRLYIIRHAEPAYPLDALTARGHRQARGLARWLEGREVDHVYSSPMNRALETARYTAKRLALELKVEPWTREIEDWWIPDPTLGERPVWQVDPATLRALDSQDWHATPPLDAPHLRQGFKRLRADGDAFLARHKGSRGLALFCHAGFALTW